MKQCCIVLIALLAACAPISQQGLAFRSPVVAPTPLNKTIQIVVQNDFPRNGISVTERSPLSCGTKNNEPLQPYDVVLGYLNHFPPRSAAIVGNPSACIEKTGPMLVQFNANHFQIVCTLQISYSEKTGYTFALVAPEGPNTTCTLVSSGNSAKFVFHFQW